MVSQPEEKPSPLFESFVPLFAFLSGADVDIVKKLPYKDTGVYLMIGSVNLYVSIAVGASFGLFISHSDGFGELAAALVGIGSMLAAFVVSRVFSQWLINQKEAKNVMAMTVLYAAVTMLLSSLFFTYGFNYPHLRDAEAEMYLTLRSDSLTAARTDDSIAIQEINAVLDSAAQEHFADNPLAVLKIDSINRQIDLLKTDSTKTETKIGQLSQQLLVRQQYIDQRKEYVKEQRIRYSSQIPGVEAQITELDNRIKSPKQQPEDSLLEKRRTLWKLRGQLSDSVSAYEKNEYELNLDTLLSNKKGQLGLRTRELAATKKDLQTLSIGLHAILDTLNTTTVAMLSTYKRFTDSLSEESASRTREIATTDSLLALSVPAAEIIHENKFEHYLGQAFHSARGIFTFIGSMLVLFGFWVTYFRNLKKGKDGFYHELREQKERLSKAALNTERQKISQDYKIRTTLEQTKTLVKESNVEYADEDSVSNFLEETEDLSSPQSLMAAARFEQSRHNYERALEYVDQAITLDFEVPEQWLLKATILAKLGRFKEEEVSRQRFVTLTGKINFDKNLQRKMFIREIEIGNLPFYGSFRWSLRSRMNILLGKNGYGKSHLLSIMLAQLQEETLLLTGLSKMTVASKNSSAFVRLSMQTVDPENVAEIEKVRQQIAELQDRRTQREKELKEKTPFGNPRVAQQELDEILAEINKLNDQVEHLKGRSLFDKSGTIKSAYGKIPVLAIPDSRFLNKSSNYTQTVIDDEAKKILEFGAYHFIRQAPYEQVIQNFLNTLAVIYFQQAGTFNDEIFRLINRVFRKLTGNEFRWHDITRTQDGSAYEIKVMSEGESDALPIQKVSQGTLSVLSMVGVIFQYLDLRYGKIVSRGELTKQSAIIVIDEIDAHLHPSWQQKIIGIMRSEFPNVQFIISAHSPVIVAGCKEGEVSVMRKTTEGFAIETIVQHLIGVPIADLFQMVFEIEEKDETYLQLAALMPFKGMILKEIETLTSRGQSLNEKDKARLEELEEQAANFNYFESFQAIKSNKTEKEELQRKYEELKVDYDRLLMEINESKNITEK